MDRVKSIHFLEQDRSIWDFIVIGGGATGLGIALDAAHRGYKTLLLEQADFTKGTSSRSTKLVHGGVRYLAQGNIKLVLEALHERGLLLKNAPHLTQNQSFIVPSFNWKDSLLYAIGLKLYDLLSGSLSLGASKMMSKSKTIAHLPSLRHTDLTSGILYHDGQFDDARLGINVAQSCVELGAQVLNYMKVTALGKNAEGKVDKVTALDIETGKKYTLKAKVIVNATGVWVDEVLALDNPKSRPTVRPSQGTHLVLDRSFLPTDHALMIPKTDDGRVLFAVPWYGKILVGTTDTLIDQAVLEPRALDSEVEFILATFGRYVDKQPTKADVLSVFTGLRPLARPEKDGKKTKEISRNHKLIVSDSNLITITGGKWTTFRKMAEDTVNKAIQISNLSFKACNTQQYRIHGYLAQPNTDSWLSVYGSDEEHIILLMNSEPLLREKLHPDYPYVKAQVLWAVHHEMARTVEDVLARRLRVLFIDAKAAIAMAPTVAELMATELQKDPSWTQEQVTQFNTVAQNYLLFPTPKTL